MKKRFGVLRALSTVLKILGVVAAVCAVLGSLIALVVSFSGGDMFEAMGLDETSGVFVGLFGAIMVLVFGLLYAVLLYGYGEFLMLMISIEDNTLRTVTLLEDVTKEEESK
ncbi:MAG: hypothetical protein HPY72_09420 [Anaerolineae bacterium]|jgi:hypothetical protein|nr:hypothetical protein [Anaerolineae bacterium]